MCIGTPVVGWSSMRTSRRQGSVNLQRSLSDRAIASAGAKSGETWSVVPGSTILFSPWAGAIAGASFGGRQPNRLEESRV